MALVAFIVDEMFEESELRVPYERLREAGHQTVLIGVQEGKPLDGVHHRHRVVAERAIDDVIAEDFDALVIPGGYSPDHLRTYVRMVGFTRDMFNAGKPVAAVCHAGSLLIEADVVDGRTVTSWPSIQTDLLNAGARWIDREVVEDGNLITSRKPDDLDAFVAAILHQLEHGSPDRYPTPLAPEATSEEPPDARDGM
jgi:protease I